jgi:hypothetical protein
MNGISKNLNGMYINKNKIGLFKQEFLEKTGQTAHFKFRSSKFQIRKEIFIVKK